MTEMSAQMTAVLMEKGVSKRRIRWPARTMINAPTMEIAQAEPVLWHRLIAMMEMVAQTMDATQPPVVPMMRIKTLVLMDLRAL